MPLQVSPGQTLTIVVENQGRVCYGPELADRLLLELETNAKRRSAKISQLRRRPLLYHD